MNKAHPNLSFLNTFQRKFPNQLGAVSLSPPLQNVNWRDEAKKWHSIEQMVYIYSHHQSLLPRILYLQFSEGILLALYSQDGYDN